MLKGYPLRKYTWLDWFLMFITSSLFLQLVAAFVMSYGVILSNPLPAFEDLAMASYYATVYGTILSLPLTLLVVHWRKIPLFNRKRLTKKESLILPGLTKKDWGFLLKYIPISYVLYITGSMIVAYFFGATEANNQVAVESLFSYVPVWVMFIMIVIVAPIVEELLFRGLLLFPGDRLETSWLRTIISAILFGAIHGPTDIYSAYTYIAMGFMFAYASKKTQTVEAGIVYHFLNNLLGFLAILSV